MGHNHNDCRYCGELGGLLLGYCDDGEGYCPAPDCTVVGHCDCNCHSGKDCGCGYSWPRMEKSEPGTPS